MLPVKWSSTICLVLVCFQVAIGLECYSCDSNEDPECATRPGQQIEVEECAKDPDHCVTVVVAGITRRGCLSRLFPNNYCPEPCDRCQSNLCNRHIFPANRLRCFQCLGHACIDVSKSNSSLLPCPVYHEKDRCYMNVIGTSNVQRGCERTNPPSSCPNTCLKCDYDGCNNELGVYEESCFECKHTALNPNPECLRNQVATPVGGPCTVRSLKTCNNKVLHGHASRCFTYSNPQTGVVERGCSSTKGFYPTGSLTECIGKNCNNNCLTIACNRCTSMLDGPNCRSGLHLKSHNCEAGTYSCFSCESGPLLRRGCVDAQFQPGPTEACYQCRGPDGCNRTPIRTCYSCSSLKDADCDLVTRRETLPTSNCSNAVELCVSTVVRRLDLVYVLRGCASEVPECTASDPYCMRCNGSLCNVLPIELQFTSRDVDQGKTFALRSGQPRIEGIHCLLYVFGLLLIFLR